MNDIIKQIKEIERLFLDNAQALTEDEFEPEDYEEYLTIEGATEEELQAFERQFQIQLPEDFKTLYRYKNGSGFLCLLWPHEDMDCGYRLLPLREMREQKSHFQNENRQMTEFSEIIDNEQLQRLDERIKPYLFCERWFPFAEYAGSLYLMFDYNPSEKGQMGQVICYVHDPDFIVYVARDLAEVLTLTKTALEEFA